MKISVSHPTKSWGDWSQKLKDTWMLTCPNESFPWQMVAPALSRHFQGCGNSILYFLRKTAPYYWSALIMRKFWSIFVWGVVACCPLVPPSHQSSSNTSRWPSCHCLLNFPFRLKIETNLLGIKKRGEKKYHKGCTKIEDKKFIENIFLFHNIHHFPLYLFFVLLNSDYKVVPGRLIKILNFLYYR